MKKFILGLTIGITLTASTAVFASNTIQAYLFPTSFYINNHPVKLDNDYEVLNYNGHAYVPIRFVAEKLGGYVDYRQEQELNRIHINYFAANKEFLTDKTYPEIHVGIVDMGHSYGYTAIQGLVSIDSDIGSANKHDLQFNLNFYDEKNKLLGTFLWDSKEKPLDNKEIRYFTDGFLGDGTKYSKVELKVNSFK
ncbi:hypothetical protein GK047_15335 [Paenibacillus sp. SYP-B3998]|uniref:Copper amine oxidase-like N-terminal domain-containing protein n=1 Tax=Paenibacillus sp. SYP-B3998 TaxID=2678564 RepID=A0A6G3ZYT1_9BACL|nr:stalk domain-containing protein [Paenibacillus sp. SYP-B3998]NEW07376.1 hypothetical protein [Paenibacillus sp. SYP-B3998]